ncbi:MAG TPA: enoyl-CoA hydratase-related protein [Ktedonobacteraceae bacterium]|nr:enoyl-CoA hydratase-related protein [Ktedonobacteraceae bacterium]
MADYHYILTERDERVGIVTLNRPKELNALSTAVIREVATAFEEFDRDEAIGCIVLTGAGEKAFAAGADIKEMAEQTPVTMMNAGFEEWDRIRRIHKPIVAAVFGYVLGGGCELALNCDILVASENTRFGQPEILLGIIPGAGGTQRLARTLGKYRTMEMVLLGAQVGAKEMEEHGLVNHVVPKGEQLVEAVKLAKKIAAQAPIAARLAKASVLAAFETTLSEGLAAERQNFFMLFSTEDQREGMHAFMEKRQAEFKGR